ncbi:MAG: hypothetical protein RJA99_3836 [Pseudomonadota bacterium]|jgi:pilus assembly protein FimV
MPPDRPARRLAPPPLPLLLACLALPGAVGAAELGALAVSSDHGRPLRATVEVLDLPPGVPPAAAAAIASPETYLELGVPFPGSLAGATATLVPTPDGRWLIRIEGRSPVAEADFNMVVSLTTDRGRQLRNYRLVQPTVSPGGAPAAAPPPSAAVERPAPGPAADASPVPASAAGSSPSSAAPPASDIAPVPGTVTVAAGDTATAIARRVAPADVTDAQAAMALYRRNTASFQGSVHRLPAGAVLTVPDAGAWRELSPAQAGAALTAAPWPGPIAAAPSRAGDRLVLGGGSGRARGADGDGGTGRAVGAVAHEAALAETQARIKELESIVEKLRRLLEATDAKLSSMQGELAVARRAVAPTIGADPAPAPPPASVPSDDDLLLPAIGAVALVAIGVAAVVVLRRRRREAAALHDDDQDPLSEDMYHSGPESLYETEPATAAPRAA